MRSTILRLEEGSTRADVDLTGEHDRPIGMLLGDVEYDDPCGEAALTLEQAERIGLALLAAVEHVRETVASSPPRPCTPPAADLCSLLERIKHTANEYGQPNAKTDGDLVCAYVEEFYAIKGNGAGGLLHIVLDDGNTETACVEFCREEARKAGDETAFWLAQLMLTFTDDERDALLGLRYCGSCCADLLPDEQHVCPGGAMSVSRAADGVAVVKGPS
jgi:hypothetical protein